MRVGWLLLAMALFVSGCQPAGHQFAGLVKDPAPVVEDFTLTDESGAAFSLSQLRGQWVLLFFGYTHCPDVCPATLQTLKQVKGDLGADAERVRVVFISVDPARDDLDMLGQYVHAFGADFKGLTGSPEAVTAVADRFDATFEKTVVQSSSEYLVSHTAFVYVLDPATHWRLTFPFGLPSAEIVGDLKTLLSEEEQ